MTTMFINTELPSQNEEKNFSILLIMLLSVVFYFYNSDKTFQCRSSGYLKELHFVKRFHFIYKFLCFVKNLWWIYNSVRFLFPPSLVVNIFFQAIYMQISIETKESEWGKQTSYTIYITAYFIKSSPFSWSISGFDVGPIALFAHHCIQ